jgi:glycosyltransferase involved in cell wall biosynthesis
MSIPNKEDKTKNSSKSERNTILIISALDLWSMGEGRGAPSLWRTIKGYLDGGWEVFFITGNRGENISSELHSNLHIIRFDAPFLKKLLKVKKVSFFARALWWFYFQLAAFIRAQKVRSRCKIDIVYGYEIYGVPVAKVLSKIWRIPVVSRFQGTILKVSWMKKRFWQIRAWEHYIGLKIPVDLIIMANDGTQGDKVLENLGVNMEKVKFWMNGVDWDLFRKMPEKSEAAQSLNIKAEQVLISVSRLAKWKRVDRSIRVLPELLSDFPNIILIIVGDGPECGRLRKLAQELGVEENVRFEGAVPHRDVPKYLAAADIFLSFYDWSNVGNPLLEAMMAGKCIITLDNGDTGKFIKNGYNGILLNEKELPKLSEIIKEILLDDNQRLLMGKNARRFAEENFWSWEERMRKEVAVVVSLIKRFSQNRGKFV